MVFRAGRATAVTTAALGDKWLLNAAVRNIDIETTATLTSDGVQAATIDVATGPWAYMIGAGYRF